jgi:hypothetical protein
MKKKHDYDLNLFNHGENSKYDLNSLTCTPMVEHIEGILFGAIFFWGKKGLHLPG